MMMSMSPMIRHQNYGGPGQGQGGPPGSGPGPNSNSGAGAGGGVSPMPGSGGPSGPGGPGGMPIGSMTPIPMMQQQQIALPQPPGGSVSLALLIDFMIQKTYNELTVMAELLPRKTDMERKMDIFNFSTKTRLLAIRLLALVKWASSAAKVDKSVHIMSFLEKQSMLFVETADILSRIARETLVHARLPNFHIPAAVEVLTTGTYNRLPLCIREKIVPPDPITGIEKKLTLTKLDQVIQHRLVTTDLPIQMRDLKIENGRVVFHVSNEFAVSLTVLGDSPTIPWKIIEIEVLVEDMDIGDGMSLVHPLQIHYLTQLAQSRLESSSSPIRELYDTLHSFAQSLQLEVLYTQALKLCRERLGDYLNVEEYIIGQSLVLGYWKELSSHDPRAELGYRVIISVDSTDPAQPLGVIHQPSLPMEEAAQTVEGLRSSQLEKMLVHTVYLRSKNRLNELSKDIELHLGVSSTISKSGSPPVLSIPILVPCLKSEQLLVTVNTHTGKFLVHIPIQIDNLPCSVVGELEDLLNAPTQDVNKIRQLVSQLRYWITQRRCEKTLQHLPASAADRIKLLKWDENQILKRIGPNRLLIKFQKHPYAILIVEFTQKESFTNEMDYSFYLIMVKKASADEGEEAQTAPNVGSSSASGAAPKFYLKPVSVLPLDTFAALHGPYTEIQESIDEIPGIKRKFSSSSGFDDITDTEPEPKKSKHPAYFVPELAHIVALCDDRLPFALLQYELTARGILHGNINVDASGTSLCIPIFKFLPNMPTIPEKIMENLHIHLQTATIRSQAQLKGFRTWNFELKFDPFHSNIPGSTNPVHFVYEMVSSSSDEHITKMVENILDDWFAIAKLFVLVDKSNWLRKLVKLNLISIKSFTWNKLTIQYGPTRSALANIMYSIQDKCYKIYFGGKNSHNPHTLLRIQLQTYLNSDHPRTLETLLRILHETYEPMCSLVKLPTIVQLGTVLNRPQLPVQTFVISAQSSSHVRVVYNGVYCLDIHFQADGLVSIRDGAYSLFDKTQVLGELTPTQGLKAFLSKYVDETAVFRRRSQSEDDNPPSPVTTMLDMDHSMNTPTGGPGSSSSLFSAKPQSPAPGRSNPHTPASPHIQASTTGFSPATSFANLASPPSLSHPSPNPNAQQQSQMMGHHPAPSPSSHVPAPSPSASGPLSVPTPSPGNPSLLGPGSGMASSLGGAQGHPSPFFHPDSSPAAVQSPWGIAGSPGMPRPSPMRVGHSPGGNPEGRANIPSRTLPQRSWAGAIPTILTHDALDMLCTPVTAVDSTNQDPLNNTMQGYPCSPLERFLGCSNLRRQLQRIVQTEDHLTLLPQTEMGVLLFRSETMQFRVGLDANHFQSLHLKITPIPEHQSQWSLEEIQLLETFFATKVVRPPFRPNGLAAFARLISLPVRIIRDLIQIIRLQLMPSLAEHQGWNWNVQLCLTVPPSAIAIIPPGMPAVVISQSKFLIYLLLTRIKNQMAMETDSSTDPGPDEPSHFIIAPLIHEINANTTQLAEKLNRPVPPEFAALSHHLKRFMDFSLPNMGMECSLFPAVQEIMSGFIVPPEGQGLPPPMPNMPGVRPQMGQQQQQMMSPAGGYPGPQGQQMGMGGPGGPGGHPMQMQ